jgi:hypothetical protein
MLEAGTQLSKGLIMPQNISLFGQVRDYNGTPIRMIRVTIYRDFDPANELVHDYTNDEGNYSISVPAGGPITVRFDTHYSLNNAREWHPSVVANVDAKEDLRINRFLLNVGSDGPYTVTTDALTAYHFCMVWNAADLNRGYSEHAAARLGMLKSPYRELQEICSKLRDHFHEQARVS